MTFSFKSWEIMSLLFGKFILLNCSGQSEGFVSEFTLILINRLFKTLDSFSFSCAAVWCQCTRVPYRLGSKGDYWEGGARVKLGKLAESARTGEESWRTHAGSATGAAALQSPSSEVRVTASFRICVFALGILWCCVGVCVCICVWWVDIKPSTAEWDSYRI